MVNFIYNPEHSLIPELLRQQGQIQAQGYEDAGQNWRNIGNALGQVGAGIAAGISQKHAKQKQTAQDAAFLQSDQSLESAVRVYGPHLGPGVYDALAKAKQVGMPKTREIETTNADGSVTKRIVKDEPGQEFTGAAPPRAPIVVGPESTALDPVTGKPIYTAPPKPTKPPEVGTFGDYLLKSAGPNPTPKQYEAARRKWAEEGHITINTGGTALTDDALTMVAQQFLQTGALPPMARDAETRKAVINRAATLQPGANVAENKLEYGANAASLKKLQQQTDAVAAFESTASKNADLLRQTMKGLPDGGAKFLNAPIRSLAGQFGSEQMAAFNAVRQSVQNEYSRILANPSLSGTMSDSARKEGEALLSGDLTLGQMMRALDVLATEARNRHQSYQDQLQAIKGRSSGKAPAAPDLSALRSKYNY